MNKYNLTKLELNLVNACLEYSKLVHFNKKNIYDFSKIKAAKLNIDRLLNDNKLSLVLKSRR